jgi:DNA-binding HxlR family transcriptional regulator
MKWDALEEEPCSLARTIGVIGDRWSLLILRECFLRTRRFEGFQSALGITRHLLAERLKKLVRQDVRSRDGMLRMRRTAFGQAGSYPSGSRRAASRGKAAP